MSSASVGPKQASMIVHLTPLFGPRKFRVWSWDGPAAPAFLGRRSDHAPERGASERRSGHGEHPPPQHVAGLAKGVVARRGFARPPGGCGDEARKACADEAKRRGRAPPESEHGLSRVSAYVEVRVWRCLCTFGGQRWGSSVEGRWILYRDGPIKNE